jgi:hypothetical protein
MKLRAACQYFSGNLINTLKIPPKKMIEIIPFSQAALVSGQNTYTQGPLADTPSLYSDRQKFIFHVEGEPF